MQLVDLETLKKLTGDLHEDDNEVGKFSYDEFKEFTDMLAYRCNGHEIHDDEDMRGIGVEIRKYLKTYVSPIKYAGMGSSRSAYACTGGKCLKVALNVRGIALNKQEVLNTLQKNEARKMEEYDFLAKTYDSDNKNYLSLWTECCSELDPGEFSRMFKHDFAKFTLDLRILVYDSIGDKDIFSDAKIAAAKKSWTALKLEENGSFGKVIQSMIDFFKHNGKDALQFNDLHRAHNWGFGIRYGEIVPVVIDAGFSKQVQDEFYR